MSLEECCPNILFCLFRKPNQKIFGRGRTARPAAVAFDYSWQQIGRLGIVGRRIEEHRKSMERQEIGTSGETFVARGSVAAATAAAAVDCVVVDNPCNSGIGC